MISEPQRHRHAPLPKPPLTTMPSHEAASSFTDTLMHGNTEAEAQEAFTGLPQHLVVTQILKSEYFDDPADLARLPSVSSAMCDTMAATGLRLKELGEYQASSLGFLSALRRLQRRGLLTHKNFHFHFLCQPANLRCCSGCTLTAARGTRRRVGRRQRAGGSRCCSGRTRTAAREMS